MTTAGRAGSSMITVTVADPLGDDASTTFLVTVTCGTDLDDDDLCAGTDPDDDGDGYDSLDVVGGTDCHDGDATIHPGATELENGVDDDCDGAVDEGTDVYDDDGDGVTEDGGDCDDTDDTVHPGAVETVDGRDEDCDGTMDEETSAFDDDGDGWTEAAGDCDDDDDNVNPAATETANGVDDDCDGIADEGTAFYDDDGDGWTEDGGDCDDDDAARNPGATEVCDASNVDEDCDGVADNDDASAAADGKTTYYVDGDADGYGSSTSGSFCDLPSGYVAESTDCDDTAAGVNPGATEIPDDGIDQDCDGMDVTTEDTDVAEDTDVDEPDPEDTDVADTDDGGRRRCGCASTAPSAGGGITMILGLLGLLAPRRKQQRPSAGSERTTNHPPASGRRASQHEHPRQRGLLLHRWAAPAETRTYGLRSPEWRQARKRVLEWCRTASDADCARVVSGFRSPSTDGVAACLGTLTVLPSGEASLTTWNCNGGERASLVRRGREWTVTDVWSEESGD